MKKRLLAVLIALVVLIPSISGCTQTAPKEEPKVEEKVTEEKEEVVEEKEEEKAEEPEQEKEDEESEEPQDGTRTVTDSDGNQVEIPQVVDKVAPTIGAFEQATCMLGAQDKVVAGVGIRFPYFSKVYPNSNPNEVMVDNMEELIGSGAQVVYGPRFSEEQIENLEKAGVKYVKLDKFSTAEELLGAIKTIADILGPEEVMQYEKFRSLYDNNIKYVTERTADAEKVKVLSLMFRQGAYDTINDEDIAAEYIAAAGGINVAGEYDERATEGPPVLRVNKEQIIEWDPDVIFIASQQGKEELLNDEQLQTMRAIQEGKIFVVPTGTYLWSVRSGEGALMPLFIAKSLHPDLFEDLSLEEKTKEFYKDFSNYDLTDEEVEEILAGSID